MFDLVLASDGVTNLEGETKRDRLVTIFGEQGFDYAAMAGAIWRCGPWRGGPYLSIPVRCLARALPEWPKWNGSSSIRGEAWLIL